MTFVPHDMAVDEKTYCTAHPTVETGLRCNKCGRYMCVKCSVRTPVGYRCKQCVYQQQDAFFGATIRDYILAGIVSFVLSLPASYIIPKTFLFGIIIFSIPTGAFIGEIVFRIAGKRRGRYIWLVALAGIVAGAVVATFPQIQPLLTIIRQPGALSVVGLQLLTPLVYVVLCAGAAAARLRYGK